MDYKVSVLTKKGRVQSESQHNALEWALQCVAGEMCVHRAPSDHGTSITITEIASGVTTLKFTYTGARWAVDAVGAKGQL